MVFPTCVDSTRAPSVNATPTRRVGVANTSALSAAKRYRVAREIAGLKQEEVAAKVGVGRTTIVDWEAGRTEPSATKFVLLALATGQPVEWFVEGLMTSEVPAATGNGDSREALSQHSVRPKGLEPLTFCFGDDPDRALAELVAWERAVESLLAPAEVAS